MSRGAGAGGDGAGRLLPPTAGYYLANTASFSGRDFGLAVLGGCVVGGAIAGLCWLLARPLEGLKPAAVKEIHAAMTDRLARALQEG